MNQHSFVKILVIEHQIEALMLQEILEEHGIPFQIKILQDNAYGNLWQNQFGWGYLFSPERFASKIHQLYKELIEASGAISPEDALE